MKFVCDQMLASLGKWLRASGYDTIIITHSMPDDEILAIAIREKRYLLTRDHDFSGREGVIQLTTNSLEEWVKQIKQEIEIDWMHAPFSRCLECNTLVEKEQGGTICPGCGKHYWLGSHTERMLNTLQRWNGLQ